MAEDAKEAPAKPKSKKMLIIALVAVLLLGGGAGGWFFFMRGDHEEDTHAAEDAQRKKELKSRVFVTLEPFTVNLADEEDRFAQVAVVLEVVNSEVAEEIKALMPAVRNRILLLLSSKEARDLLTVEGKEKLAIQIADATTKAIHWTGPKAAVPKKKKAKKKKGDDDEDDAADAEADAEKAENEAAAKGSHKPTVVTGPVTSVNFAQFIIQ